MKRIHVEPDELREFSRLMILNVNLMLDEEFNLRKSFSCLEMDWRGSRADVFMEEAFSVQSSLHSRINEFYELARKVNRESDRWEESDHTWVEEYRKVLGFLTSAGG